VNAPAASFAAANASTTSPLLFSWSPPPQRSRALFLFLIASAILHALCFYIFQVVYPPTAALLPAPARLSVISPDDPEALALLRWVEAEDPALASTTQRPQDYRALALPKLEHVPSYKNHQPRLKTLPETSADLTIPSSAAAGRMPRPQNALPHLLAAQKTSAVFSDLPAQLSAALPAFTFHLSRPDAPGNARFRVAIDRAGTVHYCFLIDSSGDPALDEQARQFLLLCRFTRPRPATAATESPPTAGVETLVPGAGGAANDHLIWSIATILWGNDFAPLPSPTPAP
jgi:hypothetical protein